MAQRGLRLTEDLQKRINTAVEERGINSAAAFIRLALQNELDRAESERRFDAMEERWQLLSRVWRMKSEKWPMDNKPLSP